MSQLRAFIVILWQICDYVWSFMVLFGTCMVLYIVVQQNTTVSLTGLPVLRTLYKPMSMNKSTNSQNCEFFFL